MELLELRVACPSCGSTEVTYSCHPDCCFNHVCESCLASFELATELLEGSLDAREPPAREDDSCKPTVACARCNSLNVFPLCPPTSTDTRLGCASCGAILRLIVEV